MTTTREIDGSAPGAGLNRRAARGGVVMLGGQILRMGIQVISVAVLARLLDPRDFGLLAMVMAVVSVAEIFRDMGLSTAAIQSKVLTREQRDNLVWINTGVGLVLALGAFFAAPLVAKVFDEPVLTSMTRAMSVMFVLNGMATQYRADLTRRMLFTRLVLADTVAPVFGLAVAVSLALAGAGHWTLVGQLLTQYGTILAAVAVGAGWLPGRPRPDVPMTGFLRFGWTLVGTQLLYYAGNNTAALILGTRLGAAPLGLYNRAYQMLMYPLTTLRGSIGTVALSALAKVQDDPRRSQRYAEHGQVALGCTLIAGLGLVIGGAKPIAAVFLGSRWDVSSILSYLAAAGALQALAVVGYWIYVSQHLTKDLMRYSVISETIKVACIVFGSVHGPVGVAAGLAFAQAISWPISLWWLSRHSEIRVAPLYAGAGRIVLLTAVTAAGARLGVLLVDETMSAFSTMVLSVVTGLLGYGLVALGVPALRRDVARVVATGRLAIRSR